MRRHEASACRQSAMTITVSDVDRDILMADAPDARVTSIPTGVDTTYFAPNPSNEIPTELVFTGGMDWYPNEDGILHFIDEILPRVRREIPPVSLTVVGRNPTNRIKEAAARVGVTITGTVKDVRPYVNRSAVYIVPLRIGGGTRMKIFEALAMGKPVVSTTVGAEGLPLTDGTHFVQADRAEDFAHAVVTLLKDPAKRKSLGAAGRKLVEERYSWVQVAEIFEQRCREAIAKP